MMLIYLRGTVESLLERRDRIAKERGLWLFGMLQPAEVPGWARTELYVGTNALELADNAVAAAFAELVTP
ncbi:MAG: hypothetical protein HY303_06630 [Candidatus Wallbacteria bacterium]|nr:hypothetical protein [Candidatus Wallbacteria bacterium]